MTMRHKISFPLGTQRFNYRVAAVIVVDLLPGWLPARLREERTDLTHVVYDVRDTPA